MKFEKIEANVRWAVSLVIALVFVLVGNVFYINASAELRSESVDKILAQSSEDGAGTTSDLIPVTHTELYQHEVRYYYKTLLVEAVIIMVLFLGLMFAGAAAFGARAHANDLEEKIKKLESDIENVRSLLPLEMSGIPSILGEGSAYDFDTFATTLDFLVEKLGAQDELEAYLIKETAVDDAILGMNDD